ncbi:hypothetical protein GCK72_010826 [Caenorhabditis remanei]|uniref:SCP domain-containing protein n=1 Tax=Caenorhabditis remanei TaxID=31234 RepID=A0A6A5H709_CAERE|nr:hypothetical protein GCK72_010826 [Caenorhabditis remanei]KAF1762564.1 hypothetical protein GCK72_010826 [Caenorhabditis remanei]
MRVDIVSTSILLLFLLIGQSCSFFIGDYQRMKPKGDNGEEDTTISDDSAVTEAPVDPSTEPTVKPTKAIPKNSPSTAPTIPPVVATTPNPNITLIEKDDQISFLANSNGHRDEHLKGRFAYVWSWDESLVESAISIIGDSCSIKIDNSDNVRELILEAEDWFKINRDRKTMHQKITSMTYTKGISRVGCVKRINCGKTAENGDVFIFCHFAPSNITEDAGFDKGYEGCEHDGTYSSLCVDAPLIPKERVTVPPVKYVYLNKSSAEFNAMFLMISVVIFGIWKRKNY